MSTTPRSRSPQSPQSPDISAHWDGTSPLSTANCMNEDAADADQTCVPTDVQKCYQQLAAMLDAEKKRRHSSFADLKRDFDTQQAKLMDTVCGHKQELLGLTVRVEAGFKSLRAGAGCHAPGSPGVSASNVDVGGSSLAREARDAHDLVAKLRSEFDASMAVKAALSNDVEAQKAQLTAWEGVLIDLRVDLRAIWDQQRDMQKEIQLLQDSPGTSVADGGALQDVILKSVGGLSEGVEEISAAVTKNEHKLRQEMEDMRRELVSSLTGRTDAADGRLTEDAGAGPRDSPEVQAMQAMQAQIADLQQSVKALDTACFQSAARLAESVQRLEEETAARVEALARQREPPQPAPSEDLRQCEAELARMLQVSASFGEGLLHCEAEAERAAQGLQRLSARVMASEAEARRATTEVVSLEARLETLELGAVAQGRLAACASSAPSSASAQETPPASVQSAGFPAQAPSRSKSPPWAESATDSASNSFKFNLNDIVQRVSKTLAQEPGAANEQLHEDLERTQSNPRGGDAAEADVQRAVAAQQMAQDVEQLLRERRGSISYAPEIVVKTSDGSLGGSAVMQARSHVPLRSQGPSLAAPAGEKEPEAVESAGTARTGPLAAPRQHRPSPASPVLGRPGREASPVPARVVRSYSPVPSCPGGRRGGAIALSGGGQRHPAHSPAHSLSASPGSSPMQSRIAGQHKVPTAHVVSRRAAGGTPVQASLPAEHRSLRLRL